MSIKCAPDVSKEWNGMKLDAKRSIRFLLFEINDKENIVVKKKGPKSEFPDHESFMKCLPANNCCFAVVEVPDTEKIAFILWAPDSAPVKSRMVYASSQKSCADACPGHAKMLHATELSEVSAKELQAAVKK